MVKSMCVCVEAIVWRQRLSFKRFSSTQVNYITAHCLGGERERNGESADFP